MTTQTLDRRKMGACEQVHAKCQPTYLPAVDIRETTDGIELLCDMPGVDREHIELTIDQGHLTLTGSVDKEFDGRVLYRESRVGNYKRSFALSDEVDTERIRAEMKAGVLKIRIPKVEKAKPRRIEIVS